MYDRTQAVRDSGDTVISIHVDVDCLTFDRVLLFLESHLLGRPPAQWTLHLVDNLARAAEVLGLRPLAEYCGQRLGAMAEGIRIHRCGQTLVAPSTFGISVDSIYGGCRSD